MKKNKKCLKNDDHSIRAQSNDDGSSKGKKPDHDKTEQTIDFVLKRKSQWKMEIDEH